MVEAPVENRDDRIAPAAEAALLQPAAAPAAAQNTPAQAPQATNAKAFKSRGWKIHNELTYRAIDWLLNSAVGVAFGFWTKRSKFGNWLIAKPTEKFFGGLVGMATQDKKSIEKGGFYGSLFVSILMGGTAIIPLMTYMEDKENKKKIIRWLDEKMYGEEEVKNNPKFEESYRRIDEEPKKNFKMGMMARFTALAPLLIIVLTDKIYDPIKKRTFDHVEKGSAWLGKKILPKKWVDTLEKRDILKKGKSDWEFLHHTIAFDFGLTIVYSFLHEIAFKALSAMGMKKFESPEKNETQNAAQPAAPESASTQSTQQSAEKSWAASLNNSAKPTYEKTPNHAQAVEKSREMGELQLAGA